MARLGSELLKKRYLGRLPRPVVGGSRSQRQRPARVKRVNPSVSRPLGLVLPTGDQRHLYLTVVSAKAGYPGGSRSEYTAVLGLRFALGQPLVHLFINPFLPVLSHPSLLFTSTLPVRLFFSYPSLLLPRLLPFSPSGPSLFSFPFPFPPSLLPFILHHPHSRKSLFLSLLLSPSVPLSPVIFPPFL